ncbi:MAG TPA: MFS transporter [Rhodothermales bacterium]|nr:MFS transporter [Rhodothermales bacterium]
MPTNTANKPGGVETVPLPPLSVRPRTNYRWVICGLLFAATTINYLDRQVISILAPTLTDEFGWTELQYGQIVSWFSFAYGFGYLFMGRLMDRLGVRLGYAFSILGWSIAAMGHGLVRSVTGFSLARAGLGVTEGGNFPAAIKAVAEWFPKRERAFATGIFNAGTNVGAVLAPLLVPWITLTWGWEWAFIATGGLGLVWVVAWWIIYRDPEENPRLSAEERAYIRSDTDEEAEKMEPVSWFRLLTVRQTWAYILAKFLTDPIWWFYLYWLPKFLDTEYHVSLAGLALPLIVIYGVADGGSIFGGWVSGALMNRGWSLNASRKVTMLIPALLIMPTIFAPWAGSMWVAVALVSVAAASHQWWSANLFTTSSDMFPRWAVASMVGLGGFAGAMGGFLFQRLTGWILQVTGSNYTVIFLICGTAYVAALFFFHLIVPKLEPAKLGKA